MFNQYYRSLGVCFVCLFMVVIMILCYNCGRKMQSHIMDLANVFYPSMYYIIVCFSHCEASLSLERHYIN